MSQYMRDLAETQIALRQELNAARALLREVMEDGGTVSFKMDDKVQSYLDACDTLGGA